MVSRTYILTEEDFKRMKQGEIRVYCKTCGRATWHKPVKPFPKSSEAAKYWSYTAIYKCLRCGTVKEWHIRNTWRTMRASQNSTSGNGDDK